MPIADFRSFLVIRRDNIGDLVCTLPLIRALRSAYPKSFIGALVNTYTSDVLLGNQDLDAVYAYSKAKHRRSGQTLLDAYMDRIRLFWELRQKRFDCVILAAPGFQKRALGYARAISPGHVLGYVEGETAAGIDIPVGFKPGLHAHEVEKVFALLAPLEIGGCAPAARIEVLPEALAKVRQAQARSAPPGTLWVALHISARKVSQRWPAERFAQLARELHARYGAGILLLWAPGAGDDRRHPGDEVKADQVRNALRDISLLAYPTDGLPDLVAALAGSDAVVCADGGAMHLAAAVGRPIVCLFGDSDPSRWHPWSTVHRVLQPDSRDVRDIQVDQVLKALKEIQVLN